jgi:trans-2,3-dihydro-3-hydroxyanthranilate isomerase
MPRYRFHTLDVFTDRTFGGNPLAVVLDADNLDGQRMQAIAAEFNLAETVFVLAASKPGPARRKVRIFTPKAELPFAGHPTVGVSLLLARLGLVSLDDKAPAMVLEEGVGDVPVTVTFESGTAVATQLSVPRLPERGPAPPDRSALADMLSLQESEVMSEPANWSCGVPFLFGPLRDLGAVGRARLRLDAWEQRLAGAWAKSVFVYTMQAESPDAQVHARMFAPALVVAEDPATGSAAAALAGVLHAVDPRDGTRRWRIEQGFEMGRPSLIDLEAEAEGGRLRAVRVGGRSVTVTEGWLDLPA